MTIKEIWRRGSSFEEGVYSFNQYRDNLKKGTLDIRKKTGYYVSKLKAFTLNQK
jgi:hypothetical protein